MPILDVTHSINSINFKV
ncbi:MAG: CRISPR-associated DxTHG motif protein [Deltaproteobacteria bacterium]|nr:CRISPR-associated DxTHG motif protein [Deltaproteobacteria bacterium]